MATTCTPRRHAHAGRRMQELEMDSSIILMLYSIVGMGPETHLDTGWDSLLLRSSYILTSALGGLTLQHWLVEHVALLLCLYNTLCSTLFYNLVDTCCSKQITLTSQHVIEGNMLLSRLALLVHSKGQLAHRYASPWR